MTIPLPPAVLQALNRLEAAGFPSYVVGGCVRDYLLGRPLEEFDLCSAATPEQVHHVFEEERIINTGIKHGTVTLILSDMPLEITTFRSDGTYSDSRRPDSVRFGSSIRLDLARRDFTCNAMAYSDSRGLEDPFGGREACRQKLLTAVGKPEERFSEDALRILRALRFAAQLGFRISEETRAGMESSREGLSRISRERVASELNGLLMGPGALQVLKEYKSLLFHSLSLQEPDAGEWARRLLAFEQLPQDLPLRWAALLVEEAPASMTALRQSRAMKEDVQMLILWLHRELPQEELGKALFELGIKDLQRLLALKRAFLTAEGQNAKALQELQGLASMLAASGLPQRMKDLRISGRDLLSLGFPEGPALGKALDALLDQVLMGRLPNQREALTEAAKSLLCPE